MQSTLAKGFFVLFILMLILQSCRYGDRGGVEIDYPNSFASPDLRSSENDKIEFKLLLNQVGTCLEMDFEDYLLMEGSAGISSWACAPNVGNQLWALTSTGQILSSNGMCLSVGETFDQQGVTLIAKTCDQSESQIWTYIALAFEFRNQLYPDKCLDVWNNDIYQDGQNIVLWPCKGGRNQQWSLTELHGIYIRNAKHKGLYLAVNTLTNSSELGAYSNLQDKSDALWLALPIESDFRIRHINNSNIYLNLENYSIAASPIGPFWNSAIWELVQVGAATSNVFQIRSNWLEAVYIGLDDQNRLVAEKLENLQPDSTYWEIGENF